MLRLLKKFWNWLKRRLFPTSQTPSQPPSSEPDDIEYENVLIGLLEEAIGGKTSGELQGYLISRNINPNQLAEWLQQFGQRWLKQPKLHQELGRRLKVLAGVVTGRLGEVARELGESLQHPALQQPQENSHFKIEVNPRDRNLDQSKEKKSKSQEINPRDKHLDDNVKNLLERGEDYLDQNEYQLAHEQFQQAIDLEPNSFRSWYFLGLALYRLERDLEAIESLNQSLQLNPNYIPALSQRGLAYQALNQSEAAKADFEQAISIQPQDAEDWRYKGIALFELERYEEAIFSYDKALEFKPDYYQVWGNRGIALFELERYEEAIFSYEKALEIKPDYYQAWNNRGNALSDLKRYEEAITSYDKALEFKPDDYQAWNNRGIAAGDSRGYVPFLHTQQLNPELNKRGYEGKLASYRAGFEFIRQETHPEGWGYLHHKIGKAQYFKGRQKAESGLWSSWDYWQQAEASYKTALLTLQPPEFVKLHLEVVKDLVQVLLNLNEVQEAQQLQRDGTEVLRRTLADPKISKYSQRKLALKFASFKQLTVDVEVQSGNVSRQP